MRTHTAPVDKAGSQDGAESGEGSWQADIVHVSGLNDKINNVQAEVEGGEGSHVTKHPVVADKDVEGWVNPFRNIVFDCHMKLEQIRQLGASLFKIVNCTDLPIR